MTAIDELHDRGQSIWLDNITKGLLDSGQLQRYVESHHVSGLTSNPSIFDSAIGTGAYDESISAASRKGRSSEDVFFDLAIDDLRRAADLFAPIHERTNGVDGWVSLEVSPMLAYDTASTVAAAQDLHTRARRANLFVKIPGTREGLAAIEECIAAGVPINVTLLFDADQYRASADAYLRGIERRIALGLNPAVDCVASVFISRWDVAVAAVVPDDLQNQLGLMVGRATYRAYRDVIGSERFQALQNAGARVQRLLWASTKTKDPAAPDTLYVRGLVAPLTINTMPDATLEAFFDHGDVGESLARGDDDAARRDRFAAAGVDTTELALTLQRQGAAAFVTSWNGLLAKIDAQRAGGSGTP